MHTRGEERVNKTTGISNNPCIWKGIMRGAVGPVRGGLNVTDQDSFAAIFTKCFDSRDQVERLEIEFLSRRGPLLLFLSSSYSLVLDNTNGGSSIMKGDKPAPTTSIFARVSIDT